MARGVKQKQKLLYLVRIFTKYTDDKHDLSMAEIIEELAKCGINAERKALYTDFDELRDFGYNIVSEKRGSITYYRLADRQFELPELKLLVDSVQAAKFITDSRSNSLIRKLESLCSKYEADQLQRQVVIAGRVKSINKNVYNNVDSIYDAIATGRQITFHYYQWDVQGRQVLRHNGALYQVSPWCLMWDDEYYYLVAYDSCADCIKHYRVDKMKDLAVSEDKREGQEVFKKFDPARYSRSVFGMHSGEETTVTLKCKNEMAGVIIDRFGKDVPRFPKDDGTFTVHVDVIPSQQFLSWVIALGDEVQITGPDSVVQEMWKIGRRLTEQYAKGGSHEIIIR